MSDRLVVVRLAQGKRWVESKTGVLWGLYHWRNAPRFHIVIGQSSRADTVFEIGLLGRCFYVAPEPD